MACLLRVSKTTVRGPLAFCFHFYYAADLATQVKSTIFAVWVPVPRCTTKGGRKANMEDKELTIKYLTEYRKDLFEKRERLAQPLQEIDQEIQHLDGTLHSLQKNHTISFPKEELFPIGKLRKLTQVQALVMIAKHNGGVVRAQEAKRLLIKAGVMRQTKNSTNIIHAVIVRSEKFERVRPGEYRLKLENQTENGETVRRIARLPFEVQAAKPQ